MKKAYLVVLVVSLILISGCAEKELQLTPQAKTGAESEAVSAEVGTGWSIKESPEEAVNEAIEMALQGKINKKPEFAIMFVVSGSNSDVMYSKAKELLGEQVKIYGGTTAIGVMTEKGFFRAEEKAYEGTKANSISIMTISSEDIDFGVGSANYSNYSSLKEAAKAAVLAAIENAGKTKDQLPNVVLITPSLGNEDEAIAGIEDVVGKKTPILGGTTGGPAFGVFGKDKVYEKGISLAVIYTELPLGLVFEGGFDIEGEHSGIVTKIDGQGIVEIDNKPALDVYDGWMNGEIDKLYAEKKEPGVIRDMLTLHPLYREYTTSDGKVYRLFSHPWPKDDTLKDRTVMTSTNIKVGDRVYISHGSWETLLNRIGNSPRKAKINGGLDINTKPLFSIAYVCGGVMGVIPDAEKPKTAILINYENKNTPFIASFTWGEQGYYPGLGSKHGNLQTGFVVIGRAD
jgi:hypothetical protein